MTKNILATVLYEITEPMYGKAKTEDYKEMHKLCVDSFKKNLVGLDETVTFRGVTENYHDVFQGKFYHLMDLHRSGDVNILYVDLDNLCVKSVEIFGKYDDLNLFCISSDLGFRSSLNKYIDPVLLNKMEPWFVTNVKYFPSTMDNGLWDVGKELVEQWKPVWAYECLIYNAMFHAQAIKNVQEYHRPEYSYQLPPKPKRSNRIQGYINTISFEQARIIHFHSTRGSGRTIEEMRRLT